jgi:hypothetical protein
MPKAPQSASLRLIGLFQFDIPMQQQIAAESPKLLDISHLDDILYVQHLSRSIADPHL